MTSNKTRGVQACLALALLAAAVIMAMPANAQNLAGHPADKLLMGLPPPGQSIIVRLTPEATTSLGSYYTKCMALPKSAEDAASYLNAREPALNVETGAPKIGSIGPGWASAQWIMRPAPVPMGVAASANLHFFQFENAWTHVVLSASPTSDAGNTFVVGTGAPAALGDRTARPSIWDVSLAGPEARWEIRLPAGAGRDEFRLGIDADKCIPAAGREHWIIDVLGLAPAPAPQVAAAPPPAPAEQYIRLRHNKHAINNEAGATASSAFQDGWFSAQWVIEPVAGNRERIVTYRNRWTGDYLGVVNGQLATVRREVFNDPALATFTWRVQDGSPDASLKSLQNLKSSLYLGDTEAGATLTGVKAFIWMEEAVK